MFRRTAACLLACVFVLFSVTGCKEQEKEEVSVLYKDTVYAKLNVLDNKLVPESGEYTKIVTSKEDAAILLAEMHFYDEISNIYDDNYFASHDLLAVAFETSPSYTFSIKDIKLGGNILTVIFNKKIPKVYNLPACYLAALIDLPKNTAPDSAEVVVEYIEITADE